MMRRSFAISRSLCVVGLFACATLGISSLASAQDAKKGEEVYTAQKCSTCHSIAGKGGKASALDGIGAKMSAADIKEWIVDPAGATKKHNSTKKPPMPNRYAKLPAGDIDSLVAYMASLK
jgi:mono/diheme cytochrome c family protein